MPTSITMPRAFICGHLLRIASALGPFLLLFSQTRSRRCGFWFVLASPHPQVFTAFIVCRTTAVKSFIAPLEELSFLALTLTRTHAQIARMQPEACSEGFYLAGTLESQSCDPCPTFSTSPAASESITACTCNMGYTGDIVDTGAQCTVRIDLCEGARVSRDGRSTARNVSPPNNLIMRMHRRCVLKTNTKTLLVLRRVQLAREDFPLRAAPRSPTANAMLGLPASSPPPAGHVQTVYLAHTAQQRVSIQKAARCALDANTWRLEDQRNLTHFAGMTGAATCDDCPAGKYG
jgi:hypothetical protein